MKLTNKERRALSELSKPVGQRDYSKVHGHTRHALERKGLFGCRTGGKPGGALTAAGRHELKAVPNIFDDLFDKESTMPKKKTVKPAKKAPEAFRALEFIETTLHDPVRESWMPASAEGGVRLYCTQSPSYGENARWHLQVRAQVKTKAGSSGKQFAIGTASMSREDLQWLRRLIDAELRRKF